MDASTPELWQMWVTFAIIATAVVFYSLERFSIELISIFVLGALLVFFDWFPVMGPGGANLLSPAELLSGFANPALIAVLALLVVGQGLFFSGALEAPTRWISERGNSRPAITIALTLLLVAVVSALLNNTPVAVMFIPILATLAARLHQRPSKVMMPLSFVCILGGMTTLIGSSTNLLAAGVAEKSGLGKIGFFDFTMPGLVLAAAGILYTLFLMPRLLINREGLAEEMHGAGKQFITQIQVTAGHSLDGVEAVAGLFPPLKDVTVRMIQRGEHPILPPFEDIRLQPGDIIIIATTRQTMTEMLRSGSAIFHGLHQEIIADEDEEGDDQPASLAGDLTMIEAVVAPGSRMIGRNIEQIGFRHETDCIVLGIQRRSRMIRARMNDIRLEDGDVLLVLGPPKAVQALRFNRDIIVLEWSATELPDLTRASYARGIFGVMVAVAVAGIVPIEVAALMAAGVMIATNVLNVRQAARALDRRIFLLVGASLAMASALEQTGGAAYLAHGVVSAFADAGPAVVLSVFFLLVAAMTNLLSNNAAAVLFVPIGISAGNALGIDPLIFVYTTIFAANCSFATPMGYQTNLLVMGPGHYEFRDFVRAGVPLILILWLVFSLFAPWYYQI